MLKPVWQRVWCGGIIATYPASGYSSSTAVAGPRSVASAVVAAGTVVAVVAAVAKRRSSDAAASAAGAVHRCSTCHSAQTVIA